MGYYSSTYGFDDPAATKVTKEWIDSNPLSYLSVFSNMHACQPHEIPCLLTYARIQKSCSSKAGNSSTTQYNPTEYIHTRYIHTSTPASQEAGDGAWDWTKCATRCNEMQSYNECSISRAFPCNKTTVQQPLGRIRGIRASILSYTICQYVSNTSEICMFLNFIFRSCGCSSSRTIWF